MHAGIRVRLTATHVALVAASGIAIIVIAILLLARTAYERPADDVLQAAKEAAARAAVNDPSAVVDLEAHVVEQLRADTMATLLIASGVALAGVVVVSSAAAWWLAGRSLRPLRSITTAARHAAAGDLDERIALTGPDDEVKALADTFDAMLARLERSFEQQRRFAADVSHELRTPLTISRTALDVTLAKPAPSRADLDAMASDIRDAIDRSERLIDGLLTLARSERHLESALVPVDLAQVAAEGFTTVGVDISSQGISVVSDLEPAVVRGDATLIARLVGNLIENAALHNRDGGAIRAETYRKAGRAVFVIENTCPPIPQDQLRGLTDPFVRGGRDRDGRGTGLGLAIVSAVARAHHAELRLSLPATDVFRAEVDLPLIS